MWLSWTNALSCRSVENWRKGKFTKKVLSFNQSYTSEIEGLLFDEYWLASKVGSNVFFWNCITDEIKYDKLPIIPYHMTFLNSTPDTKPEFVASNHDTVYYCVNGFTWRKKPASELNFPYSIHNHLATISRNRFIIGSGKSIIQQIYILRTFLLKRTRLQIRCFMKRNLNINNYYFRSHIRY